MIGAQLFCVLYFIQYVCGYMYNPLVGITGGHKISISEAPFIASLVRVVGKLPNKQYKVEICGGSIIHERFILTAAHCVKGHSYRDLIRVGSSHLYSGGIIYEVDKIISHENFSSGNDTASFTHDVALVKLKKDIMFSNAVLKIKLADENLEIKPRTLVNVTGYGKIGVRGGVSKELRQVLVEIRPIDDCMVYPWVTEDELCVWTFQKGSCKGDSGGPMTMGNVQIGIVSNGLACGYLPSIYTKVSFVLPWINGTINRNL